MEVKQRQSINNPELVRSSLQRSTKALEKPIIEKVRTNIHSGKLIQSQNLRKTLQNLKNSEPKRMNQTIQNYLKDQPINQINISHRNINKNKKRLSLFQETFLSIYHDQDQRKQQNSPRQSEKKIKFKTTLRRFSQIQQNKIHQNRSPIKQKISGAQQAFDSTKLMSITMKNFNTLDPLFNKKEKVSCKISSRLDYHKSINFPEIFRVKQQNHSQKRTFYQMHPYFLVKQDSRSLERRADKRKNLIALEQLYIRLRNKQTKNIYGKK